MIEYKECYGIKFNFVFCLGCAAYQVEYLLFYYHSPYEMYTCPLTMNPHVYELRHLYVLMNASIDFYSCFLYFCCFYISVYI